MGENFKTAAAKLLEQHAAKKWGKRLPVQVRAQDSDKSTVSESLVIQSGRQPESIIHNIHLEDEDEIQEVSGLRTTLLSYCNNSLVIFLALFGCAITVFLVPETIIGYAGNVVVGLVAGAVMGIVIAREMGSR